MVLVAACRLSRQRIDVNTRRSVSFRIPRHRSVRAGGIGEFPELAEQAACMINLTAAPFEPGAFGGTELVPANDQRKASREKFRDYRARGLEPATHPISKTETPAAIPAELQLNHYHG
jgi:hypothetical protein